MPRMLGGDRCSGATQQSKGDGECVISLWWSGQSPGLQSSIKLSVKALPRRWHLHKELEEAGSALCSFLGSCVPEQRLLLEVQLESDCGWSWVRGEWWGQEEGEGANVVGCPRPLQSIWLLSELGEKHREILSKGLTQSDWLFQCVHSGWCRRARLRLRRKMRLFQWPRGSLDRRCLLVTEKSGNEKWSDSGFILLAKPSGFADRLDVRGKKRRVKNDPRVSGLSLWQCGSSL